MAQDKLGFWLAGPQHYEHHRAVIFVTFNVIDEGSGLSEQDILNDLAPWVPSVPAGVDPSDETTHPSFSDAPDDAFYLANRAYCDDDEEIYVYEEPFGKWGAELRAAMLSLKLKLVEENQTFLLRNTAPVVGNFDGWEVTDWTVEVKTLDGSNLELVWDVITWSKDFNAKTVTVVAGSGWRIY